jgi:hypothetical protein
MLFFLLIGFVFWITSLHERPDHVPAPKKVKRPGPAVDLVLEGAQLSRADARGAD